MIQALGRTAFKSLEFLPSSLICPLCEASQAAGTSKALGIATEMWAKIGPIKKDLLSNIRGVAFGSYHLRVVCLRQLLEFVPSDLLLSFCEASQAGGIRRDLGMGTRAWAEISHLA